MTDEHWKAAVGYEGLYEVSDVGHVRSLPRYTARGWRGGKLLKPYVSKNTRGYPQVALSRESVVEKRPIHRLVLEAFNGPCPQGQEARHGPAGKSDASLANLCWGTRSDNVGADRLRDGQDNRGEQHGMHKLTEEAVRDIRRRVAAGETQRSVAKFYGVHFSTVNWIVLGKTWNYSD